MARRPVVEIKCDRCEKVEVIEVAPEDLNDKCLPVLELKTKTEGVTYHDLCKRCQGAVENYVKAILRKGEETPKEEAKADGNTPTTNVTNSVEPQKTGFLGFGKKVG